MVEMNRKNEDKNKIIKIVKGKQSRKLRARKRKTNDIWFGFGLFGIVGWSVAIPTLIGVAVGVWIDSRWPSPISWTLTLLIVGVLAGSLIAWYWVTKERKAIEKEHESE